MSQRIYLNNDWLYQKDFTEGLVDGSVSDASLESVRLPHTNTEFPFHYFDESVYQFISGYRRVLKAENEWKGKSVVLTFEGVAHEAAVFLNGKEVAKHTCGYTAFSVDISDDLKYGEDNELVVRVNSREDLNVPPFGFVIDYMTYGGIYRDVYVEVLDKLHLENLYINPKVSIKEGAVNNASVIAMFELSKESEGDFDVEFSIADAKINEFKSFANVNGKEFEVRIKDGRKIFEKKMPLEFIPRLWSPESPELYKVKAELKKNGNVIDERIVRCGFRKIKFKAEGFFLNGKKYKIRGLNRHQSFPYVGYAMPKTMQEMDADVLKKELGLNAVRTSHYPQSHYFMDRCDEVGIMVFTEIPGWQHIGDEEWKNQAVKNVEDMILQYRNHPSIILWGVRINESQDDDELYTKTNALAHELDPFRQTGGVRFLKKSHLLEDVYTYNDFSHDGKTPGCHKKSDITTDMNKGFLISEYNGHMYPTKSYDDELHRTEHFLRHARVMDAYYKEDDIAGGFGWVYADYNTHKDFGSGDRICYHGVCDMFRNLKGAGNIYRAQQDNEPVLYVSSSLDIGEHPAGIKDELWAITNADVIKMYKNDRFISEYKVSESSYPNMPHGPVMIDDFIGDQMETVEHYKPSVANDIKKGLNLASRYGLESAPKRFYLLAAKVLTVDKIKYSTLVDLYGKYIGEWGGAATVYRFDAIKDGKVVASITKEPFKKVTIEANAYKTELKEENSYDVTEVRIRALDQHGNVLPFYNDPISLSIEGDAEIIGPTCINPQGGMTGTFVKTKGVRGEATLTISSVHTEPVKIKFTIEA
ncbi:MAG: glycoside hydrolase family 2 protein [Lachnospiraceae bacterium]|nr:glycoside hydrolase family 2 protein [Lachnospiraceae bacterium]